MRKTLEKIGLSQNEIFVYEALISLKGASAAGDIIKESNLHRNLVYDALNNLHKRGLIKESRKDKKKFFTLVKPEKLEHQYRQQLRGVQKVSDLVKRLPLLEGHDVEIFEGTRAWQEAWLGVMEILKPKSEFYTIGMAGDPWVRLMGNTFVEYERWAEENKIIDKIVSQKYLQKEIESHQSATIRDIRYIDIDLPVHVSIEVFPDRVFFELYDEPETLIQIKSKGLVKTFQMYFDLLWFQAKK